MGKKLYVANLATGVTDEILSLLFAGYGSVRSAQVVVERETGRSRGFGFVEMATDAEARTAIKGLNLKEVEGRSMVVSEAKPPRSTRGGRR